MKYHVLPFKLPKLLNICNVLVSYCCVRSTLNLVAQTSCHFIMLMESVCQEFRKGTNVCVAQRLEAQWGKLVNSCLALDRRHMASPCDYFISSHGDWLPRQVSQKKSGRNSPFYDLALEITPLTFCQSTPESTSGEGRETLLLESRSVKSTCMTSMGDGRHFAAIFWKIESATHTDNQFWWRKWV